MNLVPALCAYVYIPATLRDKTLSLPSFKFLKEQLKLEIVKRIRSGSLSSACFVSSAFKSRVSFESGSRGSGGSGYWDSLRTTNGYEATFA